MSEFLTIERYCPHSRYRVVKKVAIWIGVVAMLLVFLVNWCLRDVRNLADGGGRDNEQISYRTKVGGK